MDIALITLLRGGTLGLGGSAMTRDTKQSFICPRCGMTSHNPRDVAEGYCGNCHDWTGLEGWPFLAPTSGLEP